MTLSIFTEKTVHDRFPIGTTVTVWPRTAERPGAPDIGPAGDPLATGEMTEDGVELDVDVTNDNRGPHFVAYAEVDGQHRWVQFKVP